MRAVAALLLVASGCSFALPTPTPDPEALPGIPAQSWNGVPAQTWIGVYGPPDSRGFIVLPQDLSLEVGNEAWSITETGGGGVVSPTLSDITSVRLVGVGDCQIYAAFDATPGAFYVLRFAEDGSASVEEVFGMDSGPGLGERDEGLTGCE